MGETDCIYCELSRVLKLLMLINNLSFKFHKMLLKTLHNWGLKSSDFWYMFLQSKKYSRYKLTWIFFGDPLKKLWGCFSFIHLQFSIFWCCCQDCSNSLTMSVRHLSFWIEAFYIFILDCLHNNWDHVLQQSHNL